MNYQTVHKDALEWMIGRGWKRKWGKKGEFTQSLLEHTDVELNTLFTLLPILEHPLHYNLTKSEKQAIIVGTIAHDVGKETDEWQEYVQLPRAEQRKRFVPHIILELTQATVPQLVEHLGFAPEIIEDAIAFVNIHMAAVRTPTAMMGLIQSRREGSSRWATLARVVDVVDNLCSAKGPFAAMEVLKDSLLSQHLHATYHLVQIRGVSTTMLHRAAMEAFAEAGWSPLLHFSKGTIYVADSRVSALEPSPDTIQARFAKLLDGALTIENAPQLVVGRNFSTSVIAKPELFNPALLSRYLDVASTRMRTAPFLTGYTVKPDSNPEMQATVQEKRRNLVQAYLEIRDDLPDHGLDEKIIEQQIQRFAEAQPEMGMWVLFSAAVKDGLIPHPKAPFEEVFGDGSYEQFQKCPKQRQYVNNMVYGVELFWGLSGHRLGLEIERVEQLEPKRRLALLRQTLVDIANQAQEKADHGSVASYGIAKDVTQLLMVDLIHPAKSIDLTQTAHCQLEAYLDSKEQAKKENAKPHICPICNAEFPGGDAAKEDFVTGVESHTNRALAHGRFGYIVICEACKYERYLRQLLLGERPPNVLVLFPRMNIGYHSGELLRRKAIQIQEIGSTLMSVDTANPNERLTLALTNLIARRLVDGDSEANWLVRAVEHGLEPTELIELMTYDLTDDKQKEYRRELEKALRDEYEFKKGEEDVAILNEEWETNFPDWETAVQAVAERQVRNQTVDEIWADAQKLRPIFRVVCHTPHMILVPLSGVFKNRKLVSQFFVGNDSDTNAALRELFVTLLLGLALDCSVAVIDSGEPITLEGGEGVARVPSVPAVRELIGSDWVGLTEAPMWLRRIGAAGLLARATAYPESSNLYQILSAPTPGHILRRIEQKQKGQVYMNQLPLIEAVIEPIKEVSHA